ncbi:DUF397 domain-containing protein [Thermopolyspora sp. NPDC052614]|uniref:DUF397 domain-containing protein n=1 Tax=Thermopolyspora sp. NPDC052614 TaxID=3155682 RepID=UPI003416A3F2
MSHTIKPTSDLSDARWRKSSYSGGNGACVEAAAVGHRIAVRDSKNPAGPALLLTQHAWRSFIRAVAEGECG